MATTKSEPFADLFLQGTHSRQSQLKQGNFVPSASILRRAAEAVRDETTLYSRPMIDFSSRSIAWLDSLISLSHELPAPHSTTPESIPALAGVAEALSKQVRSMRNGDVLFVPGGCGGSAESESKPLLFIVQRVGDEFQFSVVDACSDLAPQYHPRASTCSPVTLRRSVLSLNTADRELLEDQSFWFLLLRAQLDPKAKLIDSRAQVYERLLPGLISQPLSHVIAAHLSAPPSEANGWETEPIGGDASLIHCLLAALKHVAQSSGLSPPDSRLLALALQHHIVKNAVREVSDATPAHQISACRAASRHLAGLFSAETVEHRDTAVTAEIMRRVCQTHDETRRLDADLRAKTSNKSPTATLSTRLTTASKSESEDTFSVEFTPLGLWDGMRLADKKLSGHAKLDAATFTPMDWTLAPQTVQSWEGVIAAMRQTERACTSLGYQRTFVKHSASLVLAAICELFSSVVPLPLPATHPDAARCLYRRPVKYETQLFALRLLHRLSRHLAAASLTHRPGRALDAGAGVTWLCIMALTDAIARVRASDFPSSFSRHLEGSHARHPMMGDGRYAMDLGPWLHGSGNLSLTTPHDAAARGRALDYLSATSAGVRQDHVLFDWFRGNTVTPRHGASLLIHNLGLELGYPLDPSPTGNLVDIARHVTGDVQDVVDMLPEFGLYRDIALYFNVLSIPSFGNTELPDCKAWHLHDADISWGVEERKREQQTDIVIVTRMFGRGVTAHVAHAAVTATMATRPTDPGCIVGRPGQVSHEEDILHLSSTELKRVIGGDADIPAGMGGAEMIECPRKGCRTTWDSIVQLQEHIKTTHDLRLEDCERLLSYLTAPYVRIPLILSMFSTPRLLHKLADMELQQLIDNVLFEPGAFVRPDAPPPPTTIPNQDRSHLGTPSGLLFNELTHCPNGVLGPLQRMLALAFEMDVGHFTEQSGPAVLYLVRLCVRVDAFIAYVLRHHAWSQSPIAKDSPNGSDAHSVARGLIPTAEAEDTLRVAGQRLRRALEAEVLGMVERWADVAVQHDDRDLVTSLRAHTALLFAYRPGVLTATGASVLTTAMVYLTTNHPFSDKLGGDEPSPRAAPVVSPSLRLPEIEVLRALQHARCELIGWLEAHPEERPHILESAIRVATMSGPRVDRRPGGLPRRWRCIVGENCGGRYVPTGAAEKLAKAASNKIRLEMLQKNPGDHAGADRAAQKVFDETLEKHLDRWALFNRGTTELNLQLGMLTLGGEGSSQTLEPLSEVVCAAPDFVAVFRSANRVACAPVEVTEHQYWVSLVGKRHDIHLWDRDDRPREERGPVPWNRPYTASGGSPSERWVRNAIEEVRRSHGVLVKAELFWPDWDVSGDVVTLVAWEPLAVNIKENSDAEWEEADRCQLCGAIFGYVFGRRHHCRYCGHSCCGDCSIMWSDVRLCKTCQKSTQPWLGRRDVVVTRVGDESGVVAIYETLEHCRRLHRRLVFSSDARYSLAGAEAVPTPSLPHAIADPSLHRPKPPSSSLGVTRNLGATEADLQTHIPDRFLDGLLPRPLVDEFSLWQEANGNLVGYQRPEVRATNRPPRYLRVALHPDLTPGGGISATVTLHPLPQATRALTTDEELWEAVASDDPGPGAKTLIPLTVAPAGSPLEALCSLLVSLDNLGEILVWSEDAPPAPPSASEHSLWRPWGRIRVSHIELPRLRLSFSVSPDATGVMRLWSDNHAGSYAVGPSDACGMDDARVLDSRQLLRLTRGLEGGLTLATRTGSRALLFPAFLPDRLASSDTLGSFAADIVFHRSSTTLLEMGESRSVYLPVHTSDVVLATPTPTSALFLTFRLLLARRYPMALRVATSVTPDTPSPADQSIVAALGRLAAMDAHPEAAAVRLRLTRRLGQVEAAWNVVADLSVYIQRLQFVRLSCRLDRLEELELLYAMKRKERQALPHLANRFAWLAASTKREAAVIVQPPPVRLLADEYDAVDDRLCVDRTGFEATLRSFGELFTRYNRPTVTSSSDVARWLHQELTKGNVSLGITGGLGFLFFYELLTGTLPMELGRSDSLARLLIRLITPERGFQMSALRVLASEPRLRHTAPKFEVDLFLKERKNAASMFGMVFKSKGSSFENLHTALTSFLEHARIEWPEVKSEKIPHDGTRNLDVSLSAWYALQAAQPETAQRRRVELRASAVDRQLVSGPLVDLDARWLAKQRKPGGVSDRLPFDLTALEGRVGEATCRRLTDDVRTYAGMANSGDMDKLVSPVQTIPNIVAALSAEAAKATKEALDAIDDALKIANPQPTTDAQWRDALAQRAGLLMTPRLGPLLLALTSRNTEHQLRSAAPLLPEDPQMVEQSLVLCMLRGVRAAYLRLCLADAEQLRAVCAHPPSSKEDLAAWESEVELRSDALAAKLTARRPYVKQEGDVWCMEPQLLLFEYSREMLLWSSQIDLVRSFAAAADTSGALCRQLIMGAGKTTVVAPLLTLLLSDPATYGVILLVVPRALVDFSRAQMRASFSGLLSRAVIALSFSRFAPLTNAFAARVESARDEGSVLVAAPTDVKALLLRVVELLHNVDMHQTDPTAVPSRFDPDSAAKQIAVGQRVLNVLRHGTLIMDEVDLILHPLKSELNFPLGQRLPLDLGRIDADAGEMLGVRWEMSLFLVDAVASALSTESATILEESQDAEDTMAKVRRVVQEGVDCLALAATPHLILLDYTFYHDRLRPVLASWLSLWFSVRGTGGLHRPDVARFLLSGQGIELSRVEDDAAKTLTLARRLLNSVLPFALAKTNRVSYGMLSDQQVHREKLAGMARTRALTAVPFVGKDVPSSHSEFSHPDVVIMLTGLAMRYDGLRPSDLITTVHFLKSKMENQERGAEAARPSSAVYARWVAAAGGRVRGADAARIAASEGKRRGVRRVAGGDTGGLDRVAAFGKDATDVWPLWHTNLLETEQMATVGPLLTSSPHAINFYLGAVVFPDVIRFRNLKLSASAQDLGGSVLFPRRLGFSGTPSDVVPRGLAPCQYDPGSDGKMVHMLTSPAIVSLTTLGREWSPLGLLDHIATMAPLPRALIDVGALVTGVSNRQAAERLLTSGLSGVDGVVFFGEDDSKLVLDRAGNVSPLGQSGVSPARRFVFYDQVHTTGQDVAHRVDAVAVVTLGKDVVFRDLAQGAWRMRGIGKGQRLHLVLTPEVESLVNASKGQLRPTSALAGVVAWTVANGVKAETAQSVALAEQNVRGVVRQRAVEKLLAPAQGPAGDKGEVLGVFRERVDFTVEVEPPTDDMPLFKEMVEKHRTLLTEQDLADLEQLGGMDKSGVEVREMQDMDGEQQQEQDEERVKEKDEQREKEKDEEKEQETQDLPDIVTGTEFDTMRQETVAWDIKEVVSCPNINGFYPLSDLQLHQRKGLTLEVPSTLLLSADYFHYKWSLRRQKPRRLKNVSIALDICPSVSTLSTATAATVHGDHAGGLGLIGTVDASRLARAARMLGLGDADDTPVFEGAVRRLLECLGALPDDPTEVQRIAEALRQLAQQDGMAPAVAQLVEQRLFHLTHGGRWQVAVSLAEAEDVRRQIHTAHDRGEIGVVGMTDASVGLFLVHQGELLDTSTGYQEAPWLQMETARQTLRLLDGVVGVDEDEAAVLLRALTRRLPYEDPPSRVRMRWFEQIRSCRLREQVDWRSTPMGVCLARESETQLYEFRAIITSVASRVKRKGLRLLDAFRLFDTDKDGVLGCAELWGGLEWLGMELDAEDVYAVMRHACSRRDGRLRWPDFRDVFHRAEEDVVAAPRVASTTTLTSRHLTSAISRLPSQRDAIPRKAIPELFRTSGAAARGERPTAEELSRVTVRQREPHGYQRLWNSRGSGARDVCSVWRGTTDTSSMRTLIVGGTPRLRIADFVVQGEQVPKRSWTRRHGDANVLELSEALTDDKMRYLLPRPVGFKRVWEKQGGCDPLFVWQAVPIDADHVALGHIVTSTPQQPDVNSMVTVHKSWLQPASKPPRLIWTDDGAGGGRAGALWEVEPGVLFATVGDPRVTGPPDQDTFYSFAFSGKTSVGSLEPADDEAIFLDAQQDEQPSYWQHPATGMYVHPVGGSAKRNVPLKLHADGPRRNLRFCMDKNGELYHVDTELFVCVEKGGQGHPGAALMLGDAGSGPWVRGKGGVLTQARTGLVIICRGDAEDSRLLLGRAGGLEFCFTPADW